MSVFFEELDYCPTPIGGLSLRRRREHKLDVDVFEIMLGEEYLMSSLFTVSEIALARLGLAGLDGDKLDVVVGGLGLGYTANAVLENANVASLVVVEVLEPVIQWHEKGLLPLGRVLTTDPRCRIVQGDFLPPPRPRRASMGTRRAGSSTPFSSTSTIRQTSCSIRQTTLSISPKVSAVWPPIFVPAACSACGRMNARTRPSPPVSPASSMTLGPNR